MVLLRSLLGAFLLSSAFAAEAADVFRIGGTGAALVTMEQLATAYAKRVPGFAVEVPRSLGSGGAVRAVQAGAIDVAVSGRPLTADEAKGQIKAFPFVVTPFTFVTSHRSVADLKTAELPEFYTGQRTKWPDGAPIRVILRPETDTDTDLLAELFPAMVQALRRARARPELLVAPTDQDNAEAAQHLAGSLTVMTLLQFMSEKPALQLLALDGAQPTVAGMAEGTYRYSKKIYLVAREQPSARVSDFLAFVRQPEAAAIIRQNGALLLDPRSN
jgi:phosphate transport system substrate-binding protein